MQYRNKKTGALLETPCQISGGDWEPVRPPKAEKPAPPKAKGKAEAEQ